MAEALISVLLEQLVSVVYEHTKQQVKLVLNAKKDVQSFKSSLKAIQAVLQDAEKRQVTEAGVADWLQKLKDVSFKMDDVLDEWNTELLRQQVEEENDDAENAPDTKMKKKVCFPRPSHCFCFGQVNKAIHYHNTATRIRELNDELILIADEREKYHFRQSTYRGTDDLLNIQRPITTSLIDVSKIYGREEEKERLLSMLLSESNHQDERRFFVIPIVGMGGMGKTTLTQLAYNHEKVKAHFDKNVWVCVSDPFDEIKIAQAIVESLNKDDSRRTSNVPEILLSCIKELVEGKKLLLVLDDVWTEDQTKWENLKLPIIMLSCAKGSRILVTTRKRGVAEMMRAITSMVLLDKLNQKDCLALFNSFAFFNKEDEPNVFGAIVEEIVKKCQGLPLAVKTLGSLMWYKKTRREWEDVVNSEMWKLEEVEQQVFQPLLLSYYDLDSHIKRCLLYCAIFPKDYVYQKDRLIELWMSQNYISCRENKNERQLGEKYFENLVMRSFFQDFTTDRLGNIIRCKVHDIVHDFLQFLMEKECICKSVDGATQRMELPGDKFRHLTIIHDPDNPSSFPTSFNNYKNVRTLSVISSERIDMIPGLILELKCLRTLNLSGNALKELPEEIGQLIHLRYMDLSYNECLKELPDSLCSLYNLQTLLLIWCGQLEKLPNAMGKLINLKHLYVKDSDNLEYLPKGIGRLKSLRALDEYRIRREGDGDEALRLGDLGIMKQLQGSILVWELGNAEDVSEVEKASFGNKQDLLSLNLWFHPSDEEKRKSDEEILKAVQPHQNLESLSILRCHAASSWSECLYWINSLHNLRYISLGAWKFCEDLPPLGQLPSLEILLIGGMKKVKKVGFEFLGVEEETLAGGILFPKLKTLQIANMWELEEWGGTTRGGKEIIVMPRLSSLEISLCHHLKALPDFLQNIKALNSLKIESCYSLRRENEWPKISHIPNIYFNDLVNDRFEDWRAQQTDGGGNVMEVTATEEEDQNERPVGPPLQQHN